ncbi:MAG TPA: tetratricopeptide repeat protein [Polyangia bacterium]|jgi:tetratricopeptide (TPR) repeat protein
MIRLPLGVLLLVGCAAPQKTANGPRPVKDVSPLEKQFADTPDDPKVNLELGDRAAAGGDWLRSEQYYLRAEALGVAEEKIVPRLLRVLVMARRYDEALSRCRRRLDHTPTDRATRLVEAAIYEALERPKEAERELNTLVRTRPDDPNPYLALGKLYRDSYNDATRARAMFAKYLTLAPKGEEADSIRYQMDETAPDPAPTEAAPTEAAPTEAAP